MKFRVYSKENIGQGHIFASYFKTLQEAEAYANQFDYPVYIEKKIGGEWYRKNEKGVYTK